VPGLGVLVAEVDERADEVPVKQQDRALNLERLIEQLGVEDVRRTDPTRWRKKVYFDRSVRRQVDFSAQQDLGNLLDVPENTRNGLASPSQKCS
jgi:hypothetical protein